MSVINLTIANRAKAKTYDMMSFMFGALILSIALMGIDLLVVILMVFIHLFILVYNSYYRYKYNKEM
jgi:Flp pilus assembly protein TadB